MVESVPLRPVGLTAAIGSLLGGVVALYVCGVAGMAIVLSKTLAEALVLVAVFVPADLLKAAIVGMIVQSLSRVRPDSLPRAQPSPGAPRL